MPEVYGRWTEIEHADAAVAWVEGVGMVSAPPEVLSDFDVYEPMGWSGGVRDVGK